MFNEADSISCDVLVIGAGAAGVAAAVTAARQSLRVVVSERYGFAGGGAVAGLSGTVCGLYLASENSSRPEQIVFGFADEFCRALMAKGGLAEPVRYGKTWARVHEPLAWRETADDLMLEAGVRVIYHSTAISVLSDGNGKVDGVRLWTKQGHVTVNAGVTIDASGDADVAAMAGLKTFIGDRGRVQNPTMIFRLQGVDVQRFFAAYGPDTIMPEAISEKIIAANNSGAYKLPRAKIWIFATTRPGELLCNCTRLTGDDGRELNTLFYRDFTDAEIYGRRQVREYERFFRDTLIGCEHSYVNDTGVQAGVRQTRQIEGVSILTNQDVVSARKSNSSIARSPWPIELHSGAKPKVQWLLDDYYDVPFGCFVPSDSENILMAGRCLSAEHEAVASARVTAQCFSYGHAIGHAAAIAIQERIAVGAVSPVQIRERLNRDDARLD